MTARLASRPAPGVHTAQRLLSAGCGADVVVRLLVRDQGLRRGRAAAAVRIASATVAR